MPSIIQTDTLKDASANKTLAEYSSSAWSWGTPPAGTVLQVVSTTDDNDFSFTCTSNWDYGTASTRADGSHGSVADNLNVTLTTKGVNSNFLIMQNISQLSPGAVQYNVGIRTYWSVDSYANPLSVGSTSNGPWSSGTNVQQGHWNVGVDNDQSPSVDSVFMKSSNTIAKGTSVTFKLCISTYYTSVGNVLRYNNQTGGSNGAWRMNVISSHTVYEIAT